MSTSTSTSTTATGISVESTSVSTASSSAKALTTEPSATTETTTTTITPPSDDNILMYVGVGVGVTVAVVFAIVALVLWCRCRKRREPVFQIEMPKPCPPVMPDPMSISTELLVQNESLSADSLPIAPPPPQVEFEPNPPGTFEELYENTARETVEGGEISREDEEGGVDYLEPRTWKHESDDLYIPMDGHVMLEQPVPSSELTVEYADPKTHPLKPAACRGSKGYVNVPKDTRPSTPQYPKVKEEDEEAEAQEDYENVPTASHGNGVAQHNANTLPKYANMSAEVMKGASPRSLPKVPKTKVKTGQPKNTKKDQPTKPRTEQTPKKVTPKVKHKQQSQDDSGESTPDYVNVKEYSKKAGVKSNKPATSKVSGRPDLAELKLAMKLRNK